jgi:hypothetical protein
MNAVNAGGHAVPSSGISTKNAQAKTTAVSARAANSISRRGRTNEAPNLKSK